MATLPWLDDEMPTDAESPWTIQDAGSADWAIQRVAAIRQESAAAEALAREEIRRITVWLDQQRERLAQQAAFFEGHLEAFTRAWAATDPARRKTLRLPHGTLQLRKLRSRVEVTDPATLVQYLQAAGRAELLRPRPPELNKTALTQAVLADGEIFRDPATDRPLVAVVEATTQWRLALPEAEVTP